MKNEMMYQTEDQDFKYYALFEKGIPVRVRISKSTNLKEVSLDDIARIYGCYSWLDMLLSGERESKRFVKNLQALNPKSAKIGWIRMEEWKKAKQD